MKQRRHIGRPSPLEFTASDDELFRHLLCEGCIPRNSLIWSFGKGQRRFRFTHSWLEFRMSPAGRNRGKRGSIRKKHATKKRKLKAVTELDSGSGGVSRSKSAKPRSRPFSSSGTSRGVRDPFQLSEWTKLHYCLFDCCKSQDNQGDVQHRRNHAVR